MVNMRCFIDDSGNDPNDQLFVLAGWLATVQDWEHFSDIWYRVLESAPALKYDGTYRYFKHSQCKAATKCFAGFSKEQAGEKLIELAHTLFEIPVMGFSVVAWRDKFKAVVTDAATSVHPFKHEIRHEQRNPLALVFSQFFMGMLMISYHGTRQPIDLILDDSDDRAQKDIIREFKNIKAHLITNGHKLAPLVGNCFPLSDKDLAPMQAADMLAGQIRKRWRDNEDDAASSMWIDEGMNLSEHTMSLKDMGDWNKSFNIENVQMQEMKRLKIMDAEKMRLKRNHE